MNTAPSVGVSFNGAVSSAGEAKDWLGGSITISRQLIGVNTVKIDVSLNETIGIMSNGHLIFGHDVFVGISCDGFAFSDGYSFSFSWTFGT